MKIKLVFDDWRNKEGCSVYNKVLRLSAHDFHSGATFDGKIRLDEEQKTELEEHLKAGYRPVFWVFACEL